MKLVKYLSKITNLEPFFCKRIIFYLSGQKSCQVRKLYLHQFIHLDPEVMEHFFFGGGGAIMSLNVDYFLIITTTCRLKPRFSFCTKTMCPIAIKRCESDQMP